jgi:Glycosyl hydrolase family 1
VEGAYASGGRGPSIWDEFVEVPGKILNGDTGRVAVDFYNRYKDDIALMKSIGASAGAPPGCNPDPLLAMTCGQCRRFAPSEKNYEMQTLLLQTLGNARDPHPQKRL